MDALGMTKGAVSKIISRQLPIQPSTDPNYYADYRARCTTYYLPDGASHGVPLLAPQVDIPIAFDATALQTTIRDTQTGVVNHPEFMQLSMAAGCVATWCG